MKGYPSWFSAGLISMVIGIVGATGFFMIPGFLEMRLGFEMPWMPQSGLRLLIFVVHVVAGLLAVLFLGALWAVHMRVHYKQRKGIISGIGNAVLIVGLGVTGVGLQYANEDGLLANFGALHVLGGLFLILIYFWHLLSRRWEL